MQDGSGSGGAKAEDFGMTDLSERLKQEGGAALAATLRVRIEDLQDLVNGAIGAGVPFGQLPDYKQLADGLASARSVVLRLAQRSGS